MKKWITLFLGLICILSLAGCMNREIDTENTITQEESQLRQTATYSFFGENEYIQITDGSIVISDKNEIFDGGELEILQSELFENVTSYCMTFYTLRSNGERNEFHVVNATGVTDGATAISGRLGGCSGNGFIIVNLEQGLWFELITTDSDGSENVYQLELTLSENDV